MRQQGDGPIGLAWEESAQQRPTLDEHDGRSVVAGGNDEPPEGVAHDDRESIRLPITIGRRDARELPPTGPVVLGVLSQHPTL